MKKQNRKVIIIGLDGATLDLIIPWAEKGRLKTFAELMKTGTYGQLKSVLPPFSAPAWTSFMTGKNPGKHGIVDFHYLKKGSYELAFVSSQNRIGKALWDIMSLYGKRVGIINVPITYPPDKVNGFMISGLGAPSFIEKAVYPPELYKELQTKISNYIIKTYVRDYIRGQHLSECKQFLFKQVETRFECIRYLMKNKPWDLFIAVFTATDHVQHFFWKYMDSAHPLYNPNESALYGDAIYSVYSKIDAYLHEIMQEMDDQTDLFIISDHGAVPTNNKGLYLNNWLFKEGFLKFDENKARPSKYCFSPKNLIAAGKRFIPRKFKNKLKANPFLKSKIESIERGQHIEWSNTVAFSDLNRETIRINLKNREPMGIVEHTQYEKVRDQIISKLKEFKDQQTGERIFPHIFYREELYSGPYLTIAPDIICSQADRKYLYSVHCKASSAFKHKEPIKAYTQKDLKYDTSPNAVHSPEGIIIAWGKRIKKGSTLKGAQIIDIAPSILYLMNLPIPSDMDGKILTDIFHDSFLKANKVKYEKVNDQDSTKNKDDGYTKEEEEDFKKTLESLGYL